MMTKEMLIKEKEKLVEALCNLDWCISQIPEDLECRVWFWRLGLTLYVDSHEMVMKIMVLFPGKFEKSFSEAGKTVYKNLQDSSGVTIEIILNGAPPSCQMVKKTKLVPARAEHEEEYFELVCPNAKKEKEPQAVETPIEPQAELPKETVSQYLDVPADDAGNNESGELQSL